MRTPKKMPGSGRFDNLDQNLLFQKLKKAKPALANAVKFAAVTGGSVAFGYFIQAMVDRVNSMNTGTLELVTDGNTTFPLAELDPKEQEHIDVFIETLLNATKGQTEEVEVRPEDAYSFFADFMVDKQYPTLITIAVTALTTVLAIIGAALLCRICSRCNTGQRSAPRPTQNSPDLESFRMRYRPNSYF